MGRVGTRSSQKGPHETLVRHLRGELRRLPRRLVLLPRIVSGVDVGDALRTHPMQLGTSRNLPVCAAGVIQSPL
jgi:hypothetical protein